MTVTHSTKGKGAADASLTGVAIEATADRGGKGHGGAWLGCPRL
jgi:hypothetical protein